MSEEQTNSGDGQGNVAPNSEFIKLKVVGQVFFYIKRLKSFK